MLKNYEVARLDFSIQKNLPTINFQNGRGEFGLGYFKTLDEAKERIKTHKKERPAEKWPYAIIYYEGENGRIVYIEYTDSCLAEIKLSNKITD